MSSEIYQKKLEKFLLIQEEKKLKSKLRKRKKKTKKKKEINEEKTLIKKRRVGRPKKRGPKKKRIRRKVVKVVKERPVFDFKIVGTLNNKQDSYIGQYQNYVAAYAKLNELEKENEQVVFPRKFLNSGIITNIKEEYLLLEKNRLGDKIDSAARNEYGKWVKQTISNSDRWVIRDKIVRKVEETFWVYGFDPKMDRKTFMWIYDNLIVGAIENSYDVIRILVYKNKLIIKYDNRPMILVMCKNKSDSIRMYNLISEKVRKQKTKQIICIGAYNVVSDARREIEEDIMALTGWNKMKIQRSTN